MTIREQIADLFAFKGRLTRLAFWRGALRLQILLAVFWAGGLFLMMGIGKAGAILLLPVIAIMVGDLSITVRRLRDRDKGLAWCALFLLGPTLLGAGAQVLAETRIPTNVWAGLLLLIAALALGVWSWIEIGFLRGVAGANRFGEL